MMDRRAFIAGTVAFVAAPLAAKAQPGGKRSQVGMLCGNPIDPTLLEMFKQGLGQAISTDGHEVLVVQKDAGDVPARLPALAAELVRAGVAVILARGPVAVAASAKATKTIPIVAIDLESDPIELGYARTLARPGGNITGVFLDLPELSAKQLQLALDIIPRLSRVALIGDSAGNAAQLQATKRAAQTLGISVEMLEGRTSGELAVAMESARRMGAGAVLIFSSPTVFTHRTRLAALGQEKRLPTVSLFTEFAEAGGLLTYGPSLRESFRRSGVFVGKVLNGTKPSNLPIERPEKFDLVINLKTAKALGLTIPQSVLLRADEVIQ
jgi:putative tryptophan/tyrosine transport system substrate-binding protein